MLRTHGALIHRLSILGDVVLLAGTLVLSNLVPDLRSVSIAQSTFLVADTPTGVPVLLGQIGLLTLAWLIFSDRFDFYRSRRTERVWPIFWAIVETWLVSLGAAVLMGYVLWGHVAFVPATAFGLGLVVLSALRLGTVSALQRARARGSNYRRFLVVGDGSGAERVLEESQSNEQFGLRPVGYVPFPGQSKQWKDLVQVGSFEDLRSCIADTVADCVIVCPPQRSTIGEIESVFRICDEAGIPCQYLPKYLVTKNLHMRTARWGELPLLTFASEPYAPLKQGAKRAFDMIASGLALTLLLPLFAVIAFLIKRCDGGPVLYGQTRMGRNGREFTILKFRTMRVGADAMRAELAHLNEEDGPAFKVKSDPRITPIGRWLRKYSVDELPQLINVLRGDMSIVGPRPPIPEEVKQYDWWQRRRIAVRPGLTCIWQVWGRNRVPFRRWMEMDLYYVDHWTLWMDFKLIIRTMGVVLRGTGS